MHHAAAAALAQGWEAEAPCPEEPARVTAPATAGIRFGSGAQCHPHGDRVPARSAAALDFDQVGQDLVDAG